MTKVQQKKYLNNTESYVVLSCVVILVGSEKLAEPRERRIPNDTCACGQSIAEDRSFSCDPANP